MIYRKEFRWFRSYWYDFDQGLWSLWILEKLRQDYGEWGRNHETLLWFLRFHTTFVFLFQKLTNPKVLGWNWCFFVEKTTIFVYGGWFTIALAKKMKLQNQWIVCFLCNPEKSRYLSKQAFQYLEKLTYKIGYLLNYVPI